MGRGQTNQGVKSIVGQVSRECVSAAYHFREAGMKCLALGWDSPMVGESCGKLGF